MRHFGGQEYSKIIGQKLKIVSPAACRLRTLKFKFLVRKRIIWNYYLNPIKKCQLDFAGPINSKSRGRLYILVAVDRFSRWPTAKICSRTDTKTVLHFLKEYCTDNGRIKSVRTDNATCFKSNDFETFCKQEYI